MDFVGVVAIAVHHWHRHVQRLLTILALLRERERPLYRGIYSNPVLRRTLQAFLENPEANLRRHFRINRDTFQMLCRLCFPHGNSAWGADIECIIFLCWLSSAVSYRMVSLTFGIPKSTVCNVVHRMLGKIIELLPEIVSYPNEDELRLNGRKYANLSGSAAFQRVAGCIDGCHISVVCSRIHERDYFNRKLFHSINLQCVCDPTGKFINVFCGYPGSVHDSRVLRNSPMYVNGVFPPEGYCLLGDSGYQCLDVPIKIVTPYRNPNAAQSVFNTAHSKSRIKIEHAFGMMKTRWRAIFLKALGVKVETAVKVIVACTEMHNICVSQGDIINAEQRENIGGREDVVGDHVNYRETMFEEFINNI